MQGANRGRVLRWLRWLGLDSGAGKGSGMRAAVWWWPALVTAAVAQGHCCEDGSGPGHGYASSVGAAVSVQGANRGGETLMGLTAAVAQGRKDEVKVNGPSPSPFYKAGRQPKSLWANFAIIAKSAFSLQIKTIRRNKNLI